MTSSAPTAYDEVPYPSYTHVQTHPDRLATLATLFGLKPAPVARCRVLELGCGNGSNLIPMAFSLPGSEFVGIDLAAQPVTEGQSVIAELGLTNIRLVTGSITEIDADWGRFDYIIAHGLYSWVPADVRDHVLRIARENLAPQGVAFVSYSTYPGNHLRNMVREMMLFHVRHVIAPMERVQQAMALVRFLADGQTAGDEYAQFLKSELDTILEHEEGHLFHDELAEISAPLYFTQFIDHARRHGLQYLGEADYFEMLDHTRPPATHEALAQLARDRIRREQYLDFLKCRRFRQTLLCHAEVALQSEPRAEQVAAFHIGAAVTSSSPTPELRASVVITFQTPRGTKVETDFPLGKAALLLLGGIWPSALPFDELVARSGQRLREAGVPAEFDAEDRLQFCKFLLQLYGTGAVEFHAYAPPCVTCAGERPAASALARWQIRRGNSVATQRHQVVRVEDELGRHLLGLLDGTRDRAALADELFHFLKSKDALAEPKPDEAQTRALLAVELEKNMEKLARLGLLVG
ncbi:MAG: class I SAM-dependent methyltransferase [Verrucomicrobia bacterium]|nr:class I SAM-dependent methyltransferase [Verrucomicrobiota bacterium]